jgi:TonB family protein
MNRPTPEFDPRYGWGPNANDVFKARWSARLYWSIMAAVGFHALLFLWSPSWQRDSSPPGSTANGNGVELIPLVDGTLPALAAGDGAPPPALTVSDDPDPTADESDPEEEPGISDWELAGPGSALRAELRRRASPSPTLAEPEPEPELEEERREADAQAADADAQDGGGVRVGGRYSLSDYDALSEDERLALENLSALRPELAFISPSRWILIRNPSEVGEFLESRFSGPEPRERPLGSLSVAIWVDERGSVEWAEIKDSSGRRDLDEAALELFREVASFRPASEGGVSVPIAVIFWLPYFR